MNIKEAIQEATIILKDANIEEPKLKSRIIMEHVLDKTRQYLIVHEEENIDKEKENMFFEDVQKLKENIPLEYITNKKEFMKLNFYVDENVLIPRQDTEILVEEVIEIANKNKDKQKKEILDLCTGSGAISVSLAKYIKNCIVTATDISQSAINIAKKNARLNGIEILNELKLNEQNQNKKSENEQNQSKIMFIKSDLFNEINITKKYDIIVSNPPYIKTKIIEKLDKQVQKEPHIALDGGEDGLYFYKEIIKHAKKYLKDGGYLCLEIGFDQKRQVEELLKKQEYIDIYYKKDLYGNDRILVGKSL